MSPRDKGIEWDLSRIRSCSFHFSGIQICLLKIIFRKNVFVSAMKVFPFAFFYLESWCALWFQKYSSLQSNGVDDVGVNKFTVAACRNRITGWNIFPYICSIQHSTLVAVLTELFGRVIHRESSIRTEHKITLLLVNGDNYY